jgi:hypothetical protein
MRYANKCNYPKKATSLFLEAVGQDFFVVVCELGN